MVKLGYSLATVAHPRRAEMLEEAVEVIRQLWSGELVTHHGEHYVVDSARLYSLPEQPPPLFVAAAGPRAAELAGRIGDGLINFTPDPDVATGFRDAGGQESRPRGGAVAVRDAGISRSARETVSDAVDRRDSR